MKRLIIPFVAAFVVSLGGATGVVMMRAPKVAAVTAPQTATAAGKASDSSGAVVDSVAKAGTDSSGVQAGGKAEGDTTAGDTALAAGARTGAKPEESAVKTSRPAATSSSTEKGKVATDSKAPARTGPPRATPVTDSLISLRLAKVFAAMQPKDAARVLEQMNDSDVRAILGSLSSKQQAAILGSFPTERAALLVQATLRNAAGGIE